MFRKALATFLLVSLSLNMAYAQAAKPVTPAPAAKKVDLKKPDAKTEEKSATELAQPAGNPFGRPWKRSILDLRVGLYGPMTIPIGIASSVLNIGFGGSFIASAETSFIKLPKSKIFENTLLMYEFSIYKFTGTSVSSKIGKDTDGEFVTNAGAIGKAYDVQFHPKFVLRFVPYLGFGISNIKSRTETPAGLIEAVSGDVILKYGFITAYDFDRRWQAILVVDHFIYFEEKSGMALRIGLGGTFMIF